MRTSLRTMFLAIFSLTTMLLVGCASVNPVIQTPGPLTERSSNVTSKEITATTVTTTTETSAELSPAMAEMRLKMAILQKQVEEARANPCPWGCLSAYGYGYGGGPVASAGPTRDYSQDGQHHQSPPPRVETKPTAKQGTVTIGTIYQVGGH